MTDLDALLEGIVADPSNAVRWLVMADWLEENGFPERAELVRVHRELLRTCTATRETKTRKELHARMMELMRSGVQPCLPTRMITLPGGVEMRFSFIPPGSFLMGSPEDEPSYPPEWDGRHLEPLHEVRLSKGFWLGIYPVTQVQWTAVMGSGRVDTNGEMLPKSQASWNNAQDFCATARQTAGVTLRLPTEAEWEYAARAGTTTPFYWGRELNGEQANCDGREPFGTNVESLYLKKRTSVGSYSTKSPHPWGLSDVIGNVYEWCADWFDVEYFARSPANDPAGPDAGIERVRRGGSFEEYTSYCRAANRSRSRGGLDYRNNGTGFRVAADLSALA